MDSVLIVGPEKTGAALSSLLVPRYYQRQVQAVSASKARRSLSQLDWSLVVICAPLQDESARLFAGDVAEQYQLPVILVEETMPDRTEEGVITLVRPLNKALFENTLQVISALRAQLAVLREENRRLMLKTEEMRLVGRAKCILIEKQHMTENDAHRYLEKQAMDSRLPRREVARDIIQTYDD